MSTPTVWRRLRAAAGGPDRDRLRTFQIGGNPTPRDLAVFTRQFSVMIASGLPLLECLEILGSQPGNRKLAAAVQDIRREVEAGNSLAEGMRRHPRVFDDVYTRMVAAGEAGGVLDTIFRRLSTQIEKSVKLRSAMRSAMVYPAAVVAIAGGVVTLILWRVVPAFTELFASMDVALPLPTRIVIGASAFIGEFGLFVLAGSVVGGLLLRSWHGTPRGRAALDAGVLRLPVFGILVRKIAAARFTRTTGTLIASGVPILDALDVTARTSGNAVVEAAVGDVRMAVESGRTIVEPLQESGVFPGMAVRMIGVGERTGALSDMLDKIADFYEDEVDMATADLMTAVEPMMMAALGVLVGGIVVSMYMPIFSLVGRLSG